MIGIIGAGIMFGIGICILLLFGCVDFSIAVEDYLSLLSVMLIVGAFLLALICASGEDEQQNRSKELLQEHYEQCRLHTLYYINHSKVEGDN